MKVVIDNKEEVYAMVKQIVAESYQMHVKEWDEIKDKEPKIELMRAMDRVFDLTYRAQTEKSKQEIAFINVHYLRASLLDESFSLLINTYSERYYLDAVDCFTEWVPKEINSYFEEDMENLEKKIIQKNIMITQKELFDIRKKHYFDYIFLLLIYVKQCLEDIVSLKSFMRMKKKERIFIQYGEIYGQITPIYISR